MRILLIAVLFAFGAAGADAAPYRLTSSSLAADAQPVVRESDGGTIPANPGNADYQAYLAWLAAGGTPDVAPAPVAPPPTAVAVISTSDSALNGTYAIDPASQQSIMAVSLYVQVNGRFPAGQAALVWSDASGAKHAFTSTAQFQAFATALADYVTALSIGQAPSTPLTIP